MDTAAWIALAVFVVLNLAAASTGGLFKPGAWYEGLKKPSWTPPNWMFPVVWALLYCLIANAGWLIWQKAGLSAWPALTAYVVSLGLNAAWSWLFFGRKRMDHALVDVGFLWLSIVIVVALFWMERPLAAVLMLPYLVWVSVAAVLNLRMTQLNPRANAGAG